MFRILLLLVFSQITFAQSVNAIIGDRSWQEKHGNLIFEASSEKDRIATHLNYVIHKLKTDRTHHSLVPQRKIMLKLLQEYIDSARFPNQFYYSSSERRPCFIDDNGRLCAVGYLIAKTAGRLEAEGINRKFRFHYLADIQDEKLLAWQKQSGLSMDELAMIQPTYEIPQRVLRSCFVYYDPEKKLYGLRNQYNKNIILKAKYDQLQIVDLSPFVIAKKGSDQYLLNLRGKKITKTKFQKIQVLGDGDSSLALTFINDMKFQIWSDSLGLLQSHDESEIFKIFNSFIVLRKGDSLELWRKGIEKIFLPPFSDVNIKSFSPRLILELQKDALYGLAKTNGELICSIRWQSIEVKKGFYIASSSGKKKIISHQGKQWDYPSEGNPFYTLSNSTAILDSMNFFGIYDSEKSEWVLKPKYQSIRAFSQYKLYEVKSETGTGFCDYKGHFLIPPVYSYTRAYDKAIMVRKGEKMGLINYQGGEIIPIAFDTIAFGIWAADSDDHTKVLFKTTRKGKLQLWTFDGKEVALPAGSKKLYTLSSHLCLLKMENGMRTVISKKQNLQFHSSLVMDTAYTFGFKGLYYKKQNKWGFYRIPSGSQLGPAQVRPAVYDTVLQNYLSDRDRFMVQKNGLWGMYSFAKDELIEDTKHQAFYPIDLANRMEKVFLYHNGLWHLNDLGQSKPPLKKPFNANLTEKFNTQKQRLKAEWLKSIP